MKIDTEEKKIHGEKPEHGILERAAGILKAGGIVAFPTDTVYGLAVSAFVPDAKKKLCHLKGRSFAKPLVLMAPDISSIEHIVKITATVRKLMNRFWPGPLTLILPTTELGKMVMGGRPDAGVRIPDDKLARSLLRTCGFPLLTTSANPSGEMSAKTGRQAVNYFSGMIEMVLDGGSCAHGRESTVIDATHHHYVVVREGCLPSKSLLPYL